MAEQELSQPEGSLGLWTWGLSGEELPGETANNASRCPGPWSVANPVPRSVTRCWGPMND